MPNRNISSEFDIVILTAANESQAAGYRAQLTWREQRSLLPSAMQWFVVTDPGEQRVGSGGSTVEVLRFLTSEVLTEGNTLHDRFAGKRVLIAHSGGDARRLPAYSALGKVFLPLPCDVTPPHRPAWEHFPASVFDILLQRMSQLPPAPEGEVLICSGDVLLTFNAAQTHLSTPGGVTGLGFAVPPLIGQQHGVYVTETPTIGGTVVRFLQKPSLQMMEAERAVDLTGRISVDTGVFSFSPVAIEALLQASGITLQSREVVVGEGLHESLLRGDVGEIDLYREIIPALAHGMEREKYLEQAQVSGRVAGAREVLASFYERIRSYQLPFHVVAIPDGEFFHIGTTGDLLSKLPEPSRTGRGLGFANGHRTRLASGATPSLTAEVAKAKNLYTFNAVLPEQVHAENFSYIEGCDLEGASLPSLPGANLLVGLASHQGEALKKLEFSQGIGVASFPFQAGVTLETATTLSHIPILFGVDDDNKTTYENDGLFLNMLFSEFVQAGLPVEVLWGDDDERSGWTALLWMSGEAGWEVLAELTKLHGALLAGDEAGQQQAVQQLLKLWQSGTRYSLAQIVTRVDHDALLRHRRYLKSQAMRVNLMPLLLEHDDLPIASLLKCMGEKVDLPILAAQWLGDLCEQMAVASLRGTNLTPLLLARLHRAVAILAETAASNFPVGQVETQEISQSEENEFVQIGRVHQNLALSAIEQAVESSVVLAHEPSPAAILHDQVVWVTAPARIDFAGGWSDTPPICLERGGIVLNAAVTLNGQYPIQVIAKLNKERCIRLTSIDLGRQEVYHDAQQINGPADLTHWSSLAKAALVLSGIVPNQSLHHVPNQELGNWLDVLGGGLDLTLFSGLPKGSGMGTSSILGAAVLACLARVLGRQLSHHELIAQTSLLEQRLTSGGGWQDQVGGIVAGVKLIQTQPGIEQTPHLQWSVFGGTQTGTEDLQRRMLMYYSGHKRLARDILHNVVSHYLARDPETLAVIDRLKSGAIQAKEALEANDIVAFSQCLSEYWQLKKMIDPGSTNAHIEEIMTQVEPYVSAASVCGAGGGGFMLFIARDEEAVYSIHHCLQTNSPHGGRFFDFQVDGQGLKVSVL